MLLLERVGERRYQELVAQAAQWQLTPTGFQEVTSPTLTVFDPQPNPANRAVVAKAQQTVMAPTPATAPQATAPVDWQFLAQQTTPLGLAATELNQYRTLIAAEKQVYGLEELQLAPLLVRATDVNGHLDPARFKRLVHQAAPTGATSPAAKEAVAEPQPARGQKQPTTTKTPATASAQALIAQADRYAPLDYLQALKAGTNSGFVSSAEKNTLERLAAQTELTNGAINVLAHYVLVEQGKANLTANFANAIANNWTRQGVRTAADAVAALSRYWAQTGKPRKRRSYQAAPTKKRLPEWAKHPQQRTDSPATTAQIQRSKARLAKLRAHQQQSNKRP